MWLSQHVPTLQGSRRQSLLSICGGSWDLVTTCKWAYDPTCNWGSPGKLTKTSTHSTGRGSVLSMWGRKGVHAWVNGLKTLVSLY